MSVSRSVEYGKFKLKKAFQSGKILACSKKYEIYTTSTLKLIKMMLDSASLFHMHALLESDYPILTYILHFFASYRGPKWWGGGGGHGTILPPYIRPWMCMS